MAKEGIKKREVFGSKIGAIAAAAGAAVGLGNIWGFPYQAGKNGGSAFIIIYLAAIVFLGIPLMIAEFLIGQKGQKNMIGSFNSIAPKSGWKLVGWMGVVASFLVLGFYGVIAGWSISYFFKALFGSFNGQSADTIAGNFGSFISGYTTVFWHFVFMAGTAIIVIRGIRNGIEKFAKIIMPLLFGILLILALFGISLKGSGAGLAFLFRPDFSVVSWKTVAIACGAAFFSLGVGIGVMITLGSYLKKDTNITKLATQVSLTDSAIAIIAGIAIFPAVFALGFEPTNSSGLVFITVPAVFQAFPGGAIIHYILTLLFFALLPVAALTSSVTTLELVVAYFTEELKWKRIKASIVIAGIMFLIGIPFALSVGAVPALNVGGMPLIFFVIEALEAFILPIGGIAFAIFVGWVMKKNDIQDLMAVNGKTMWYFTPIYTLIKFVIPVVVLIILVFTANEYYHIF
ncbi:MAG: sodium-dependent transporter [Spirochaetia bacterium]|jgi:NSS family neurotransmitter:Na+ symporter|nr:sodium-dependent transporter [Spirochaetia bacterium]